MTIRELSILFEVTDVTIRRAIKKAFPNLLQHGVETRLTSAQVKQVFGHLWVKGGDSLEANSDKNVGVLPQNFVSVPQNAEVNPRDMVRLHRQALDMIEAMLPKVEVYDQIADSRNAKTVAQVAQVLGTGQKRLFKFMRDSGILNEHNRPYQEHVDAKRLIVRETTVRIGGQIVTHPQVFITGKGELWLAGLMKPVASRLLQ